MLSKQDKVRDKAYYALVGHAKSCTWCRYPATEDGGEAWPTIVCKEGQAVLGRYLEVETA